MVPLVRFQDALVVVGIVAVHDPGVAAGETVRGAGVAVVKGAPGDAAAVVRSRVAVLAPAELFVFLEDAAPVAAVPLREVNPGFHREVAADVDVAVRAHLDIVFVGRTKGKALAVAAFIVPLDVALEIAGHLAVLVGNSRTASLFHRDGESKRGVLHCDGEGLSQRPYAVVGPDRAGDSAWLCENAADQSIAVDLKNVVALHGVGDRSSFGIEGEGTVVVSLPYHRASGRKRDETVGEVRDVGGRADGTVDCPLPTGDGAAQILGFGSVASVASPGVIGALVPQVVEDVKAPGERQHAHHVRHVGVEGAHDGRVPAEALDAACYRIQGNVAPDDAAADVLRPELCPAGSFVAVEDVVLAPLRPGVAVVQKLQHAPFLGRGGNVEVIRHPGIVILVVEDVQSFHAGSDVLILFVRVHVGQRLVAVFVRFLLVVGKTEHSLLGVGGGGFVAVAVVAELPQMNVVVAFHGMHKALQGTHAAGQVRFTVVYGRLGGAVDPLRIGHGEERRAVLPVVSVGDFVVPVVLFAVVEPDVVGDAVLAAVVAFVVDAAVVIDVRADDQSAVGVVVVPKTLRGELVVVLAGHENTVNGDLVIGGVVNFQHAGAICSPAWERNGLAVAVDLVIEGDLVVVGQSRHGTIDSLLRGVVAERKRVPGAVIADAVIEIAAGLAGNAV